MYIYIHITHTCVCMYVYIYIYMYMYSIYVDITSVCIYITKKTTPLPEAELRMAGRRMAENRILPKE